MLSKENNMKFTDQNGQYNFEGFTSLEDFVAAELVKYPHTAGLGFYHEAGVFTIEQKIKWDIYGMISDASKDLNGFRARFDFLQFSVEELYADYESYVRMIDADNNYEENLQKANIQAMLDAGAPDEETAARWAESDEWDYEQEAADMWNAQVEALEDSYHDQLESVA
jgi:hypothetical protein